MDEQEKEIRNLSESRENVTDGNETVKEIPQEEETSAAGKEMTGETEGPKEEKPEGTKENAANGTRGEKKHNWKFVLGLLAGFLLSLVLFLFWRGYFTLEFPYIGVITVKLPTYGLFGETANGLDLAELNRKLDEIGYYMENEYYYAQDNQNLVDAAITGVYDRWTSEDDYAEYYTKEEYLEELQGWNGSFVGIGVYVMQDEETGGVLVVRPIKGGPAAEAGIREGDVIVSANGTDLTGMDLETATEDYIKGDEGTTVDLVLLRDGEQLEMTVERRTVNTESVYSSIIEQDGKRYGYVYVSQFLGSTYDLFVDAVDRLCLEETDGIVIDLRDDTGGDMNVCLNMADYLLEDRIGTYTAEETLSTNRGRTRLLTVQGKNQNAEYYYAQDGHEVEQKLVVLVNGYSASASEIFAGIMQCYGATVCGTTTFGKGIVQTVRMLYDMSGIKYTSAEYILPDGSRIHGTGLEPDIAEEPSEALLEAGADAENPDPEEDNMLAKALEILGEKN